MKLYINLILILVCFFNSGCSQKQEMPDSVLMEELLQTNPDSLAYILEEQIRPDELSENEKLDYVWWLTSVHQKQDRSLINDSLIHRVLEYDKKTDSPRLFRTYRLAFSQFSQNAINIPKAKSLMDEALALAQEKTDTAEVLALCSLKVDKIFFQEAKDNEALKTAVETIKKYSANHLSSDICMHIISLYEDLNQQDSVVKYAQQGIDLSIKENNLNNELEITRNYSNALNRLGQSQKALQVLRNIENKYKSEQKPLDNGIQFNYIFTWIELGKLDSAQVYIDSFKPLLDLVRYTEYSTEGHVAETLLDMLKDIIQTKKGESISYIDMGASLDLILRDNRISLKNEKERIFSQNKLQKDKLLLQIEKKELQLYLLVGAIILILIIAVLVFIYQRRLLENERSLQKTKEELRRKSVELGENELIVLENEELIGTLTSQVDENEDIRNELNQLVTENEKIKLKNKALHGEIQSALKTITTKDKELDYLDDLSVQNAKLLERDQLLTVQLIKKTKILNDLSVNPRYIDEQQWHEIINTIDQLFNEFSVRIRIEHPTLTDEDIKYCCLLKLRLSNPTIASLMGISPSSVTKRKQRIKEKINQDSSNQTNIEKSVEIYLWNYR